jgi:hypothetical protein
MLYLELTFCKPQKANWMIDTVWIWSTIAWWSGATTNNRIYHRRGRRFFVLVLSQFYLLLSFYTFWKSAACCTLSPLGFSSGYCWRRHTCHLLCRWDNFTAVYSTPKHTNVIMPSKTFPSSKGLVKYCEILAWKPCSLHDNVSCHGERQG